MYFLSRLFSCISNNESDIESERQIISKYCNDFQSLNNLLLITAKFSNSILAECDSKINICCICCICLASHNSVVLVCNHRTCTKCIIKWLNINNSCMICRNTSIFVYNDIEPEIQDVYIHTTPSSLYLIWSAYSVDYYSSNPYYRIGTEDRYRTIISEAQHLWVD